MPSLTFLPDFVAQPTGHGRITTMLITAVQFLLALIGLISAMIFVAMILLGIQELVRDIAGTDHLFEDTPGYTTVALFLFGFTIPVFLAAMMRARANIMARDRSSAESHQRDEEQGSEREDLPPAYSSR